jgi:hypothetical protein
MARHVISRAVAEADGSLERRTRRPSRDEQRRRVALVEKRERRVLLTEEIEALAARVDLGQRELESLRRLLAEKQFELAELRCGR